MGVPLNLKTKHQRLNGNQWAIDWYHFWPKLVFVGLYLFKTEFMHEKKKSRDELKLQHSGGMNRGGGGPIQKLFTAVSGKVQPRSGLLSLPWSQPSDGNDCTSVSVTLLAGWEGGGVTKLLLRFFLRPFLWWLDTDRLRRLKFLF